MDQNCKNIKKCAPVKELSFLKINYEMKELQYALCKTVRFSLYLRGFNKHVKFSFISQVVSINLIKNLWVGWFEFFVLSLVYIYACARAKKK